LVKTQKSFFRYSRREKGGPGKSTTKDPRDKSPGGYSEPAGKYVSKK